MRGRKIALRDPESYTSSRKEDERDARWCYKPRPTVSPGDEESDAKPRVGDAMMVGRDRGPRFSGFSGHERARAAPVRYERERVQLGDDGGQVWRWMEGGRKR